MRFESLQERFPFVQQLLIVAVIAGVLAFSVLVGALVASGSLILGLLVVALPFAIIGLSFALRFPQFLVLLLPLFALFLPKLELPTGTASVLPMSLLIATGLSGLWFVAAALRGTRLVPSPLNRPLLIFSTVCIFSLGWGIIWRDPILLRMPKFIVTQVGSLISILMSMGAALLIGNYVTSERQLKYIFALFIAGGALMTATQFFKVSQTYLNDRGLWGLWTVAPILGLLIMQPKVAWYWRAALLALLVFNLYQTVVVNSLWLSGWLPSIVAIIVILFIRSPRLFLTMLPFGALVLAISYGFLQMVAQNNVDEGGLERLIIWQQNWRIVKDHWLFGVGPAGYAIYYMSYFPEEARSTHNNYLDIVAQFGVVGLLLWFWLAGVATWEGWKLSQYFQPGFKRTVAATVTAGWVAGLASMMLGDWLLPFAYNQGIAGYKYTVYTWIFLGMLIVLRQMAHEEELAQEPADPSDAEA